MESLSEFLTREHEITTASEMVFVCSAFPLFVLIFAFVCYLLSFISFTFSGDRGFFIDLIKNFGIFTLAVIVLGFVLLSLGL